MTISARSGPTERETLIQDFAKAVAAYAEEWKQEWNARADQPQTEFRKVETREQGDRLALLSERAEVAQRIREEMRATHRAAAARARLGTTSSNAPRRTDSTVAASPTVKRSSRILKSR
ncbi:hypothetical protein [Streptomyces globisporus]|uniref:hypothetical protein n=1 Tax=Streptomyces globisporus TaxID=1908 RepID=UPI003800E4AC